MPKLSHIVIALLAMSVSAGCQANPDYSNTQYRCGENGACPSGFTCVAGYVCEVREECGNTKLFSDDFGGAEINDDRWQYGTWGSGGQNFTLTQVSGRFELAATVADAFGYARTRQYYAIEDSVVAAEVVFSSSPAAQEMELSLYIDDQNAVWISHNDDSIELKHKIDGTEFRTALFTYVPELHRWWRLRESKGLIFYETSPNGEQWQIHGSTSSDPFLGKQVAIDLYAGLSAGEQAPASVYVEHINPGGVTSEMPWCPAARFSDDFGNGELDRRWDGDVQGGCDIEEDMGQVMFLLGDQPTSECRIESRSYFDLSKSSVIAELASAGGANSVMGMRVSSSSGDSMEFSLREATLTMTETIGGMSANVAELAFQTEAHRFWRIRGEGGSVFWEASADGESFAELARHKDIGVELSEMTVTLWARATGGVAEEPVPAFATVNPLPDAPEGSDSPESGVDASPGTSP